MPQTLILYLGFHAEEPLLTNYFPHSIEEFLSKIPRQYEIVFYEHYTLPFLGTLGIKHITNCNICSTTIKNISIIPFNVR